MTEIRGTIVTLSGSIWHANVVCGGFIHIKQRVPTKQIALPSVVCNIDNKTPPEEEFFGGVMYW